MTCRYAIRSFPTFILAVCVVLSCLSGCAFINRPSHVETTEEMCMSSLVAREKDHMTLPYVYLDRAMLRLGHDNPRIDYKGALDDLRKAVSLEPDLHKNRDVGNWLSVLERLKKIEDEGSQIRKKNEQVERQNLKLQRRVDDLEKQAEELKKTINDLQLLELQMERRRQLLR